MSLADFKGGRLVHFEKLDEFRTLQRTVVLLQYYCIRIHLKLLKLRVGFCHFIPNNSSTEFPFVI